MMSRTHVSQKQYEVSQRNVLATTFSRERTVLEPSSIIKTMIKIIKIKTKENMGLETRIQFLWITDSIVRMVEDIRE